MTGDTGEPTETVEASEATPLPDIGSLGAVRGVAVRASGSELILPEDCACCGAAPVRRVREAHFSGRVVFVPYCAECHAHVSREETRRLAASLSSAILALTLAAGLPLVWQPRMALPYAVTVLLGGLLPIVLGALWPRRRKRGHAASGPAAVFRFDGTLACGRSDWGLRLADGSRSSSYGVVFRERRVPRGTVVLLAAACAVLPVYYRVHFPAVRVVNLTDGRLEIAVDGRFRASIPPTSAESTGAGVELRVAAGQRALTATDGAGRIVDSAAATVRSGGQHLYAPASEGYCFWIETTGYGRSKAVTAEVVPLVGPPRFWAFSDAIDLWFSPLPDADFDDRSTGGILRAIRQARCEMAPGAVRRPAGGASPAPFATGVE